MSFPPEFDIMIDNHKLLEQYVKAIEEINSGDLSNLLLNNGKYSGTEGNDLLDAWENYREECKSEILYRMRRKKIDTNV